LASRHHSLDLSEIADVTDMLFGFEEHNNCQVTMNVSCEQAGKVRTLIVAATAWRKGQLPVGVDCLASVSVTCSALNLRNWNSALTHALYALDFQLALKELGHAEPKKQ
jgi:hypothetical protein